jgi:hypothetical protein
MRAASTILLALPLVGLAAAASTAPGRAADPTTPSLQFAPTIQLPGADGDTEPRAAVTPDDHKYVVSNSGGPAVVYGSADGLTWGPDNGVQIATQDAGSIDTDIVSTRTGRLIAVELDFGGINFRTSYSDDGGATWTPTNGPAGQAGPFTGTGYADQDRPYLAVGPDDPSTHLPRVYALMHNLASGAASHNMWVATSTDNGASFGPFVPITQPGSQAWFDLQCADSGGPSNLFVDPTTGRVFAVWGSRSTNPAAAQAGGGCGASATGSFEINVVAATRVWIASAPASGVTDPTQWTQSLAVDDNASGQIVGMQLSPGAVDAAGNVYVLFPESMNAYPDYSGAAIKYVHATVSDIAANPYGTTGPANQVWSAPVTVAPAGQPGNVLAHIVAGASGALDIAYFHGKTENNQVNWYPTAAQTLDALDAAPTFAYAELSTFPAYANATASQMMGACGSGPTQGVQNGFGCTRSTDIWGVATDNEGNFLVTWPGDGSEFNGTHSGTFVSMQTGGTTIAGSPTAQAPEVPWVPALAGVGLVAGAAVAGQRRRRRSA